jgi:hypothetical protein
MKKKHVVIIDKNDFKFTKNTDSQFNLTFEITNNNIILPKIINFELINLIFKLNPNIFASVNMQKGEKEKEGEKEGEEKEVNIYALLKDIFCEIGLPQYYCSLNIKRIDSIPDLLPGIRLPCIRFITNNNINNNNVNSTFPKDSESLPIEQIVIDFDVITNHHVKVNCDITLTDDHNLLKFTEKIIGNMIYNIFNKVKQFIENITFNI